MRAPHKHAEIIKAWADGAEVQFRRYGEIVWKGIGEQPCWFDDIEYRIKPAPKPDVVMTRAVGIYRMPSEADPHGLLSVGVFGAPNVRFVFDGETKELKSVEVL